MKAQLTEEEFINWWLEKYHATNLTKVLKLHPEWETNPEKHTRDFYYTYRVTQAQHDEWYEWAIGRFRSYYRWSKKRSIKAFCFPYLNVAPSVIDMDKIWDSLT